MEYQIFVIGDSIVFGKKDTLGGWADRLKIKLIQKSKTNPNFSANVYNLGIPGDTSQSLFSRFSNEIVTRQQFYPNREAIAIIAFGANDAGYNTKLTEFKVKPKVYRENILHAIKLAKNNSIKPILLNITPVLPTIEDKADKYGNVRNNKFVQQYNQILEEISKIEKCPLINLYQIFKIDPSKYICDDGLHPNSVGHEMIELEVETFLDKVLVSS